GIVETESFGLLARKFHLFSLLNVGHVSAKNVFKPANGLNTPLAGRRQHRFKHIVISKIRRAKILNCGIRKVFGIIRGEAAAMKIGVIFLFAMIGKRLTRYLAAFNSA